MPGRHRHETGSTGEHAKLAARQSISLQSLSALRSCIIRDMEVGARITAKGQVTIPTAVRRALDLDKGDEVIFEVDPGPGTRHAQLRKAADFMALAGSVPVPAEWASADWSGLRTAAWLAQAENHHDPAP